MPQFDVYKNTNPESRKYAPYLLDVQNDLLEPLRTRVVVPLVLKKALTPISRLNPEFSIGNKKFCMSTAELAGISITAVGGYVCSLALHRQEIVEALDFLITGI